MKFKLIAVLCMLGLSVSNVSAASAVNTVVAADNVTLTSNVDAADTQSTILAETSCNSIRIGGVRW